MALIQQLDDDELYREYFYERWSTDNARVVRVLYDGEGTEELETIERETKEWLGPIHPRLSTTIETRWEAPPFPPPLEWQTLPQLHVVIDDDRGPALHEAAATLVDPIERERWSVAQIIGICDACTMLRERAPDVSVVIGCHHLFIDISGRARMKAPAPHVHRGRSSTRTGGIVSTSILMFLSPEQCTWRDKRAPASDVFVLASNLYYALTSRYPFTLGENPMANLIQILQHPVVPFVTHLPELHRVMMRAFEKKPADRYPSAAVFADELRRCVPDAAEYDAVISDRIVSWRAAKLGA